MSAAEFESFVVRALTDVALPRRSRGASGSEVDGASPYRALLASDTSRLRRARVTTDTGSHVAIIDEPAAQAGTAEVPESAESLTADRLIDVTRTIRPAPQGGFNRFLYDASFHLVNLGDSAKVRAHRAMSERIQRRFEGGLVVCQFPHRPAPRLKSSLPQRPRRLHQGCHRRAPARHSRAALHAASD